MSHVSSQQKELWFRAAVIAVPIAGGFILVLLVLLAVRLLRNDSLRHRHHLLHIREEQQHYQRNLAPIYKHAVITKDSIELCKDSKTPPTSQLHSSPGDYLEDHKVLYVYAPDGMPPRFDPRYPSVLGPNSICRSPSPDNPQAFAVNLHKNLLEPHDRSRSTSNIVNTV